MLGLNVNKTSLGHMPRRPSAVPLSPLSSDRFKGFISDVQLVSAEPRNFISLGQQLFYVFSLIVMMASLFFFSWLY